MTPVAFADPQLQRRSVDHRQAVVGGSHELRPGAELHESPGLDASERVVHAPIGPWAPLASDQFCVFTGTEFPNAVLNDVVVVVDKSGSMGYRLTPLDLTAFEAAFSAGLGHFNRTPSGKQAGLSVFDSTVTQVDSVFDLRRRPEHQRVQPDRRAAARICATRLPIRPRRFDRAARTTRPVTWCSSRTAGPP